MSKTTLTDVLEICASVTRFMSGLRAMHLQDIPRPGSPAYADWATFPKTAHLHAARNQAVICLEVAAEHVAGLIDALEQRHVLLAWTCLRVAIESSATSQWLTVQGIEPTARVARGLAVRHQSISQMLSFVRATHPRLRSVEEKDAAQQNLTNLSRRFDRLESEGASIGLPPVRNKKGDRIGAGTKWPGSTRLIESVFGLDEALMYRAASVVVHSNPSALLDFTLTDKPPTPEGRTGLRKALDASIAARMCATGIDVYAKAFWSNAMYMGEGLEDLAALLDVLARELQMPSERWFWRT